MNQRASYLVHVVVAYSRLRFGQCCEVDDIIDSLSGLWTAERIQRGEAITLPAIPPVDAKGIRMEMVA